MFTNDWRKFIWTPFGDIFLELPLINGQVLFLEASSTDLAMASASILSSSCCIGVSEVEGTGSEERLFSLAQVGRSASAKNGVSLFVVPINNTPRFRSMQH